jgi:hypothetical protein
MELELEKGRPVDDMDSAEPRRALGSASGLLGLNPTQAVRVMQAP